jgi:glycerol-3-phosphate acyltransferase PlsX
VKIALDAAAGDFGLAASVEGALLAAQDGVEAVLVGPREALQKELRAHGVKDEDPRFEIEPSKGVVEKGEDPLQAFKDKPACGVLKACEAVAAGKAAGVVSAGPPDALNAASAWHLKRLPGVLKPALAAPIPTLTGVAVVVDAGANPDCKPWHLLQFAVMGSIYALHILKRERPRVALLSGAGSNELLKEARPLLKASGLEFIGLVGGADLPAGAAEVFVCDGFTGDLAVKLVEGAERAAFRTLDSEIPEGLRFKAGKRLLKEPFERAAKRLSREDLGGCALLGVGAPAICAAPRGGGKSVARALLAARDLAETGITDRISKSVDEIKKNLETSKVNF